MVTLRGQICSILHTEQLPLKPHFPNQKKKTHQKANTMIFYIASIGTKDISWITLQSVIVYTLMYRDFHRMIPKQ